MAKISSLLPPNLCPCNLLIDCRKDGDIDTGVDRCSDLNPLATQINRLSVFLVLISNFKSSEV